MSEGEISHPMNASGTTETASEQRYLLAEGVALRSWADRPFAYVRRGMRGAAPLPAGEFWLALACDGERPLTPEQLSSTSFRSLVEKGLIVPAGAGSGDGVGDAAPSLEPWQRLKVARNRFMSTARLTITGRCNFNCRHCFMASDNAPLMGEMGRAQLERLLDEIEACGFQQVNLTGGEPLVHPDFPWLLREIYARGMAVGHINTNASLLTHAMLAEWKAFMDPLPSINISFDGLGHHDWLRNRTGAEREALEHISLAVAEGFPVCVNLNVWKGNLDTLFESLLELSRRGVGFTRVARTSESPRWLRNGGADETLSPRDYLEVALDLADRWMRTEEPMGVYVWQILTLDARKGIYVKSRFEGDPSRRGPGMRFPLCRQWADELNVNFDGEVIPCNTLTGRLKEMGMGFGNAFETPLAELMEEGPYAELSKGTIADLARENETCASCEHLVDCGGGCRAIAVALAHGTGCGVSPLYGCDRSRCLYFAIKGEDMIDEAMANVARETGRPIQTFGPDGELHEAEELLAKRRERRIAS